MLKSIFAAAFLLVGLQVNAETAESIKVNALIRSMIKPANVAPMLDWKVGDYADYSMSGGIIKGTMHSFVREEVYEGFWAEQDMDLGFIGKQKVEILFDKNSGQVLQLLVNGQKQTPPSAEDSEVVEVKEDHVRVPKGEFDCYYVKMKDTKSNEITEAWVNPELVPLGGMIKTIAPSQLGPITVELTDFKM